MGPDGVSWVLNVKDDGARLASDVMTFRVSLTTPFNSDQDVLLFCFCVVYSRSAQPIGLSDISEAMVIYRWWWTVGLRIHLVGNSWKTINPGYIVVYLNPVVLLICTWADNDQSSSTDVHHSILTSSHEHSLLSLAKQV